MRRRQRAFTLVEILIVVIILGILAAVVVPQFASAVSDTASGATFDQISKLRRALAVYYVMNNNNYPVVTAGNGTWGALVGPGYMREAPFNNWVGGANGDLISIGNAADTVWHQNYGWVWDPATGNVWAAGFDANDQALPRP